MTLGEHLIPLLPELILLVGACAALMSGISKTPGRVGVTSAVALTAVVAALLVTLSQGTPDGSYTATGLWLTPMTYYVRLIGLSIGSLIVLVNWQQPTNEERGEYMSMILFSLLGVLLTASSNDLVVLFFAIELVSIPTYVLIGLSRQDARSSESAVKYFFLGAMAAAILAYGLTFLYGHAGTTAIHTFVNGSPVSALASTGPMSATATIGFVLVFLGLAFKIAAVPLHAYVADVYEGAASPVTGMLGFVPKFAGFVALIKIFTALNWSLPTNLMWMLWIIAAVTMTAGNVLALLQHNVKRMLAYSSIAHTGYMLVALLVGPVAGQGPMHDGVAALLFYIAVYGAMNLGAFAILTATRAGEHDAETLDDLAGLSTRAPLAAFALAICVFSLMGFPPTAGFLGKLYIFSSAFSLGDAHPFQGPLVALAIIGVVNSAIGAAYYLRIVAAAYIKPEVEGVKAGGSTPLRVGLALCSIPMLILFAWPGGLARQASTATVMVRSSVDADRVRLTLTPEDEDQVPTAQPHESVPMLSSSPE